MCLGGGQQALLRLSSSMWIILEAVPAQVSMCLLARHSLAQGWHAGPLPTREPVGWRQLRWSVLLKIHSCAVSSRSVTWSVSWATARAPSGCVPYHLRLEHCSTRWCGVLTAAGCLACLSALVVFKTVVMRLAVCRSSELLNELQRHVPCTSRVHEWEVVWRAAMHHDTSCARACCV